MQPAAELNTTPLIDVMLVLLVMMIMTLPALTHATRMQLPGSRPVDPPAAPAVLEIDYDGQMIADGIPLASAVALDKWLLAIAAAEPQRSLQVRPDRRSNYGLVAMALAAAQRQGVRRLGVTPIAD